MGQSVWRSSFRHDKWVPLYWVRSDREDDKFSFELNIKVLMDMLLWDSAEKPRLEKQFWVSSYWWHKSYELMGSFRKSAQHTNRRGSGKKQKGPWYVGDRQETLIKI